MTLNSGWRVMTLDAACAGDLQTGPFGSQLHADEYVAEGIPVVMPKDIVGGRIVADTASLIPPARADQLRRHRLQEGDVVFSRRGDVARAALVSRDDDGFICGTGCLRARPDKSLVHPPFLSLLVQTASTRKWLESNAVGQTMPNMNTEILSQLTFRVPPIPEQESIANVTACWDAAIQKTEQLIAAKERRYTATSSQLLFGKARLKKFGTSKLKSLHWFSVSSDWSVVEIGEIAREVSAVNKSTDALPVLSCTKYDGLVDSLQYFNKQVFSHDTAKYKLVRHGQFAYATNHIEEGSIGYQDCVPAGLVSPIYTVFQSDSSRIHDGYLYKLLKTEKLRQLFAASTNASVDRRGSLRWKEFARIHIPLPSLEEQLSISNFLDATKQEIDLLRAEVAAIRTQKRGLMQKLLTGQWRLHVPMEVNS